MYFVHKKCNYCNSVFCDVIFGVGRQNLVKCRKCGLVYFDRQRKDLKNLYNKNYFFIHESNNLANYADYSNQERLVTGNFKFAYTYIKNNTSKRKRYSLLDVGAGFGYFLKYLPSNVDSEAVEVSRIAVKRIESLGQKVYQDDFLNVDIKKKFDFIISFDVIEHQIEFSKYLKKIHLLLKRDGVFLITVPNYGSVFNKILGRHAPIIQPLYHNYYFTKEWLKRNLSAFGFEVLSLKTRFTTLTTLDHIILMSSFTLPFMRKNWIIKMVRKYRIDSLVIPFIRLGGIEGILKRNK